MEKQSLCRTCFGVRNFITCSIYQSVSAESIAIGNTCWAKQKNPKIQFGISNAQYLDQV